VAYSFNDGRSRSVWQGFSLRWWFTDPHASLWRNDAMRNAIANSLILSISTMLIVTPLGITLAIGAQRIRGRSKIVVQGLTSAPLITPEIVVGAALLLTFTRLFTMIPLGYTAQLLGNVTFSLSSVVIIVRARLISIGSSFEEAARDLGATSVQALRFVLMPMLWPSVMASLVVVFAMVIDDFVITSFLSSGVGSETVPLRIYASVRGGATPALNALATLLVITSFTVLIIGLLGLSTWRKQHGERGGLRAALADVTQMEN
jgi:spermidine/putrescine transport system permease protein